MNNRPMWLGLASVLPLLAATVPATAQEALDYRLPPGIEPVRQAVHLDLDPAVPGYSGRTTLEVEVAETTDRIGIHQTGLELTSIVLSGGDAQRTLSAAPGDWEINWLSDGDPIEPGTYELNIEFSGSYSTDALGMHRVTFEDRDYVFTQMEAMYARRAFPLFDEPSFKIPWQLTVTAPEGLTVISNTPEESSVVEDGSRRVRFMETKPLPSYLLAWAVGPLDRAPIEGMSVPGFVYTPAGHADEVGFVQRETPRIVAALEDYFGSDYPFRKLDFVAVPDFAFGAMENPGLITYRTDLLMVGDEVAGSTAVQVLNVIAHEVAHIWYGDVVTMAWWDDLWLNEAFASWMAWSTLERLYPRYEPELNLPQINAFGADQQAASKPIRRTVRNEEEVTDGLGLNYTKGHALLGMLESYVGADVWRDAIREYIKRYAWSNATERDLWGVVSDVSGLDVGAIASDYLNQPGFPLVNVDETGKVRQQRFTLPGVNAPELDWSVPLNVKYKQDGEVRQTFYLLDEKTGTIDLPATADWVFPDAGANGYYRWSTDTDRLYALIDDLGLLTDREKIALLDNSQALFSAGELAAADYMFVLQRLLDDPQPLVFLPALENLKTIGDEFIDASTLQPFQGFVDGTLGERFARVGAETREGDSEPLIQMRPRLLRVVGEYGSIAEARSAARDVAERFLADPGGVETSLAREALRVTALHDDGGLYDDYIEAYRDAETANARSVVLTSIYFDEPAIIEKHLDFSLSDEVPAGDAVRGLSLYAAILEDNTPVYDWLGDNLEAFKAKIPSYYHSVLPQIMGGGCDEAALARLEDFFGGEQVYASTLSKAAESIRTCIDRRKRHGRDLTRFLESYTP